MKQDKITIEKLDKYRKITEKAFAITRDSISKGKEKEAKEIITMVWKLNYTLINLVFDYKYKIIDEFGCCSYSINIDIIPVK